MNILEQKKIVKIRNGIILPFSLDNKGGVRSSDHFIDESKSGGWLRLGGDYPIKKECHHIEEKVLFLGFCVKHWGHFLMECLGRAWILLNHQYDDYKIVFLLKRGSLDGNYLEFFELLGVGKSRFIEIQEATSFSEVLIPYNASIENNPELYREIFRTISQRFSIENSKSEKIYLSRRHFKKARKSELGESDIEKVFVKNEYLVRYPEELSLSEQVKIFSQSSHIACVNGTIPLMCVFSSSSLDLVVLNKTSFPHHNLILVCRMMGIKPTCIDVYKEPIKRFVNLGAGPFWMQINKNLEEFFSNRCFDYQMTSSYRTKQIAYFVVYFFMLLRIRFLIKTKLVLLKMRNAMCVMVRK